jgi:hypothetical protein
LALFVGSSVEVVVGMPRHKTDENVDLRYGVVLRRHRCVGTEAHPKSAKKCQKVALVLYCAHADSNANLAVMARLPSGCRSRSRRSRVRFAHVNAATTCDLVRLNFHPNVLTIMPVQLTHPECAIGRANLARKVVQVYDGTFALGGVRTPRCVECAGPESVSIRQGAHAVQSRESSDRAG